MIAAKNAKVAKADWKTVKLGEIIVVKYGKDHKRLNDGPYPVYGSGGYMRSVEKPLTELPSLLIPRKGTLNNVMYSESPFWTVDTMFWAPLRDEKICNLKFVYYRLKLIDFQKLNVGSAVPSLTVPVIEEQEISLPPLPTQRKIAEVLGALDDKIENNRKICANLEAQAQALFKSWFVDFEPWDGKMPDGWKMGKLGDVAEIVSGKRPLTRANEKDSENQYPLLGASCIMGFTSEFMYDEPILVTGRVGTHGIIQRSCEKCWPSDNTLVLKTEYYEFVYQQLLNIDYSLMNRGSTQPLITQSDLKGVSVIMPNEKILREYEERASVLMSMWLEKRIESHALAELRDALLPKLMSGELDVSEVAV